MVVSPNNKNQNNNNQNNKNQNQKIRKQKLENPKSEIRNQKFKKVKKIKKVKQSKDQTIKRSNVIEEKMFETDLGGRRERWDRPSAGRF